MEQCKVSIIVPVYNCLNYLNRCVESIIKQTFNEWELIMVDDGSTDGSSVACDNWAEKDTRIVAIHQENKGASAARNAGLDTAKGDYICFVDSDDWVEPMLLERIYRAAQETCADMVLFDPYVHRNSTVEVDSIQFYPKTITISKSDITPEKLRYLAGAIWRFLYRKELIDRNKIQYDIQLPLSEDRLFNIMALGCSKTIHYLREPLYHYVIRDNSATGKFRPNFMDVVLMTQSKFELALTQYWDVSFIPVYEKVNLVDGALLGIYNTFSRKNTAPFWKRYAAVKNIVNNQEVQAAIEKLEKLSIRQRLLRHKQTLALCLVGIAWNVKNR